MTKTRDLRRLLQDLSGYGVLIGYALSPRWGQSITVWGEDGRPVRMSPAAAMIYARRLEWWEWGWRA